LKIKIHWVKIRAMDGTIHCLRGPNIGLQKSVGLKIQTLD